MADLPRLGRETDVETGYALVCNATPGGNPLTDAICGKLAVLHVQWEEASTENGFACEEHLSFALGFNPWDCHDTGSSACGMPGSFWVRGQPSHCTMLALDDEPDRSGHVALEANHG
jgi:hypothetical protein